MNATPAPRDPDACELDRLQRMYGDLYQIRRVSSMWIASRRVVDGHEPTIMKDTAAELEAAMRSPSPGIGRMSPLITDAQ